MNRKTLTVNYGGRIIIAQTLTEFVLKIGVLPSKSSGIVEKQFRDDWGGWRNNLNQSAENVSVSFVLLYMLS
ncbi:MAG: hypothetical protein FWH57_08815 [Oscillospiraceae bacterium]|nr:hypothetical protein [Oscillospiraceae bacterium]